MGAFGVATFAPIYVLSAVSDLVQGSRSPLGQSPYSLDRSFPRTWPTGPSLRLEVVLSSTVLALLRPDPPVSWVSGSLARVGLLFPLFACSARPKSPSLLFFDEPSPVAASPTPPVRWDSMISFSNDESLRRESSDLALGSFPLESGSCGGS